MKKLRLHKSALSNDAITTIAATTLSNGGFVAAKTQPRDPDIGAVMPDGTVYAGISPETSKPMYATPADAPLTYTFNEAQKYAQEANAQNALGHNDWRVPTKGELCNLFFNRAKIGGFNVTGSARVGWYWSATPNLKWSAWGQRFSDGAQYGNCRGIHSSVRLVRSPNLIGNQPYLIGNQKIRSP